MFLKYESFGHLGSSRYPASRARDCIRSHFSGNFWNWSEKKSSKLIRTELPTLSDYLSTANLIGTLKGCILQTKGTKFHYRWPYTKHFCTFDLKTC